MNMKQHLLAALREIFEEWERQLAGMSEAQLTLPLRPSDWSIKDFLAHLYVWQQRSLARCEAARLERAPVYPDWPVEASVDPETVTDVVNAWVFSNHHNRPWAEVHQAWRAGFLRLLESAGAIDERSLLDGSRYAWLDGCSLADVLLGSYDHHREHLDGLQAWLKENDQDV